MPKCEHRSWIDLAQGRAVPQINYGSRLAQLTGELPNPSIQLPQVIFFMGRQVKNQALRQLCGSNYRGQGRHHFINLRLDNRTWHSSQPRFFADCDPLNHSLLPASDHRHICHQEQVFPVELPPTEYSFHDLVLSRVLFLFVDVICIFADDVGGPEKVRDLLLTWAKIGSASTIAQIRPRVIIVASDHIQSPASSSEAKESFLSSLIDACEVPLFTVFSDIQISRLRRPGLSPEARYMRLGNDMVHALREMRIYRDCERALFSATHLNAFFELSLRHSTTALLLPFNFVHAARQQNPLDGSFVSHLIEFIALGNRSRAPYDDVASYIASAILMDAYPPGMHRFCPSMMFHTLYREACYTALRHCYSTDVFADVQCRKIESYFSAHFEMMTKKSVASSEIHKRNLESQSKYWGWVRSNKTCLWCIRRNPEHPQSCGHTFCDTCTEIFGEPSPHMECEYLIRVCILCGGSKGLTVRLKPSTAAPRVLSIDGGGPRGIIPLENLEIVQELLGPDLPINDLFELKVGSSSGGIIVLTITILAMHISQCKALFCALARKIFAPARRKRYLSFWLADGAYDTIAFERTLKEHFGESRRLFDAPRSFISSGKVAVTATSIKDGAPYIFANYNGAAPHRLEPAYGRIIPDLENEPFVWEIARATAAAPPLFPTIDIPGLGTFQDGGMRRHNNPVNLALSEARHLWPNTADPDILVSLGTGSEVANVSPGASRFRNILVDGWVPRVYRSLRSSFDGQTTWRELVGLLDDSARAGYFRFDSYFPDGLPAMDNTECMDDLSEQVRKHPGDPNNHQDAVTALLVSCFFFRLDAVPEYRAGLIQCTGTIRCRTQAQALITRLSMIEPGRIEFFKDKINLGLALSTEDICQVCHRYSLPVRFVVRDLEEVVTLSLRLGAATRRLSAFPNKMQWFIDEQQLNCPFGSANHSIPLQVDCPACSTNAMAQGNKRKYI